MARTNFTDSKGTPWHVGEGLSIVWTPELGFDDHPETVLMFDCVHEARRLFEYPSDWATFSDSELQKLLDKATQTWERQSERADWVPVHDVPLPEIDIAGTVTSDDVAELLNPAEPATPSEVLVAQVRA